ncbi:MAG: hypothetical protein HY062_13240 [Bacteroidetes bacterium]|nr:hypothetical protein [Bacteroidota bacterium]
MTALALKKQIHKAIDLTSDESILEAVYTILNKTNSSFDISDHDLKLIESRKKQFLKGELGSVSLKDIRKKASKQLKK